MASATKRGESRRRIEPEHGDDVVRAVRRVCGAAFVVPDEVVIHAGHHQRRIVLGCRSCGASQDVTSTTPLGDLMRSRDHMWIEVRTEVRRFSDEHGSCPPGTRYFWAPGNRRRSFVRYEVGAGR